MFSFHRPKIILILKVNYLQNFCFPFRNFHSIRDSHFQFDSCIFLASKNIDIWAAPPRIDLFSKTWLIIFLRHFHICVSFRTHFCLPSCFNRRQNFRFVRNESEQHTKRKRERERHWLISVRWQWQKTHIRRVSIFYPFDWSSTKSEILLTFRFRFFFNFLSYFSVYSTVCVYKYTFSGRIFTLCRIFLCRTVRIFCIRFTFVCFRF